jgi:hypothetical protein
LPHFNYRDIAGDKMFLVAIVDRPALSWTRPGLTARQSPPTTRPLLCIFSVYQVVVGAVADLAEMGVALEHVVETSFSVIGRPGQYFK